MAVGSRDPNAASEDSGKRRRTCGTHLSRSAKRIEQLGKHSDIEPDTGGTATAEAVPHAGKQRLADVQVFVVDPKGGSCPHSQT
ncbi:gsr2893 [Gloeobacter violaceus PCC 7421]|uniref:Gsr2893 protein n=1 Tax=Gloeobacter violaceus (strain ATCC 29082 / PCC 7421) TaxID=251221 RepID=Q7NCT3_GLOVI|nr:gsr2893 [Gloeobacter violaceus PCC 7421]